MGFSAGKTELLRLIISIDLTSARGSNRHYSCFIEGDSKYLSAMRLASGFLASLPNLKLSEHQQAFDIGVKPTWPWFYLRNQQIFLFSKMLLS